MGPLRRGEEENAAFSTSLQSVLVCEKTRRAIGGDVSDNSVNSPVQEVMPNLIKNNGTSIAESPSFQLTMAAAKREKRIHLVPTKNLVREGMIFNLPEKIRGSRLEHNSKLLGRS